MVLAVDLSFMRAVYRLPTSVCSIAHVFSGVMQSSSVMTCCFQLSMIFFHG